MNAADFRRIALSLRGAEESSHMGAPDFRVGGRIFATLASQHQGYGTMANVQGQFGAFFKTRVVLFNPTALSYVVAVSLYGPNGTIEIRGTNMPANTQKVWNDFLGEAFGYSGAGAVQFDSWFIPLEPIIEQKVAETP